MGFLDDNRPLMVPGELRPGTRVMVLAAGIAGIVNDHPALVAMAEVVGPADQDAAPSRDGSDRWWLNVHMGPGVPPLPQMYRRCEILGIPALGLTMAGLPDPDPQPGVESPPND